MLLSLVHLILQEKASQYLSNSRNKLNLLIEEENNDFEKSSRELMQKFETELEKKKSAVLADSEQIAYDVSNDIISRVFGENPLVKDTLKDNIKSMVKR